jgi:hypothetical protein
VSLLYVPRSPQQGFAVWGDIRESCAGTQGDRIARLMPRRGSFREWTLLNLRAAKDEGFALVLSFQYEG